MATIERAIDMASALLDGHFDKGGSPLIQHVLAVMNRVQGPKAKIVAVLHEVKEDAGLSDESLRAEGFDEDVIRGVDAVSRREGESYNAFIDRSALDPLGAEVKAADLAENQDLSRIPSPSSEDFERLARYQKAAIRLASRRAAAGTL